MQHCTCKEETGADQWIHLTWDTWVYVLFEFFMSYYIYLFIYLFNLSLSVVVWLLLGTRTVLKVSVKVVWVTFSLTIKICRNP